MNGRATFSCNKRAVSSSERGAVIAEYVLQLQIILFLVLVAIPALKEDIEGTFNEASYAMLIPQSLEMSNSSGGTDREPGGTWENNNEDNTNNDPVYSGGADGVTSDPGNGPDEPVYGGGTMTTEPQHGERPGGGPPALPFQDKPDGGDGGDGHRTFF